MTHACFSQWICRPPPFFGGNTSFVSALHEHRPFSSKSRFRQQLKLGSFYRSGKYPSQTCKFSRYQNSLLLPQPRCCLTKSSAPPRQLMQPPFDQYLGSPFSQMPDLAIGLESGMEAARAVSKDFPFQAIEPLEPHYQNTLPLSLVISPQPLELTSAGLSICSYAASQSGPLQRHHHLNPHTTLGPDFHFDDTTWAQASCPSMSISDRWLPKHDNSAPIITNALPINCYDRNTILEQSDLGQIRNGIETRAEEISLATADPLVSDSSILTCTSTNLVDEDEFLFTSLFLTIPEVPSSKSQDGDFKACPEPNCGDFKQDQTYSGRWNLTRHMRDMHPLLSVCYECKESFGCSTWLSSHAEETAHAAFICGTGDCKETFSRQDIRRRHMLLHMTDGQRHCCNLCRKYRGQNGFKRKDHLTQHLRNYHHIGGEEISGNSFRRSCPHENCPQFRKVAFGLSDGFAFHKASDYTAHMRKLHNESPFPCDAPGCDRKDAKGYFRERDLIKHKAKAHAPSQQVVE